LSAEQKWDEDFHGKFRNSDCRRTWKMLGPIDPIRKIGQNLDGGAGCDRRDLKRQASLDRYERYALHEAPALVARVTIQRVNKMAIGFCQKRTQFLRRAKECRPIGRDTRETMSDSSAS
jgi:hypothetical protein